MFMSAEIFNFVLTYWISTGFAADPTFYIKHYSAKIVWFTKVNNVFKIKHWKVLKFVKPDIWNNRNNLKKNDITIY